MNHVILLTHTTPVVMSNGYDMMNISFTYTKDDDVQWHRRPLAKIVLFGTGLMNVYILGASVHRSIGAHLSKVKHLKLDKWEDSQVERIKEVGNKTANEKFERIVPLCYLRPNEFSNQYVSNNLRSIYYKMLHAS